MVLLLKILKKKKPQNLYQIYDKFTLDKIREEFNKYRFESAKNLFKEITNIEEKELYQSLVEMYRYWDNFNHENSVNFFSEEFNNVFNSMYNQIITNLKIIDIIRLKGKNTKLNQKIPEYSQYQYYILADILNNAYRRAEEGKYDDAIARLYRSLEFIAQIRLDREYDLNSSNIIMKDVKKYCDDEGYILSLNQKIRYDKIKLGLQDSYELLDKLNDVLGVKFKEYTMDNGKKSLNDILSHRNMSILAHGTEHKTYDDYLEFKKPVLELAKVVCGNIKNIIKEAEFPKFNLN